MFLARRLATLILPFALVVPAVGVPVPTAIAAGDPVGAWPLQPAPEITADFDPPSVVWAAGHRGVDLLGTPGQAVQAALPGSVAFAGMLAGRGVVVVSHGDTRTTYEPVTASVAVGTIVAKGDVIGQLTLAGSHCPPRACLHWGWLRGPTYLDPLGLVGVSPIRLLPLWRDGPADPPGPLSRWSPVPMFAWLSPYAALLQRLAAGPGD